MKKTNIAALAACLLAVSCATPPTQRSIENSRTFAVSKDQAWEALLSYFTSNNIQIKTIEKDSGVIYAERALSDASMADCGAVPLAQEMSRPASLNVFVRETGDGVQVTVNAQFEVTRMFDGTTWTDACFSTGLLERQLLTAVEAGA